MVGFLFVIGVGYLFAVIVFYHVMLYSNSFVVGL